MFPHFLVAIADLTHPLSNNRSSVRIIIDCYWYLARQGTLIIRLDIQQRIWSRETGSVVPSRISLLISILRLNLGLTGFLPISAAAFIYLFKPPYAIGLAPGLSVHAIAYRWRSLQIVRRHRASKLLGSSSNGCCLRITMDQIICALFFHTHYWYEVGMSKVSAGV